MDSLENIINQGARSVEIGLLFEEGREEEATARFVKLDRKERVEMVLVYIEVLYLPDDEVLSHALAHGILLAIVPLL